MILSIVATFGAALRCECAPALYRGWFFCIAERRTKTNRPGSNFLILHGAASRGLSIRQKRFGYTGGLKVVGVKDEIRSDVETVSRWKNGC